MVRQIIEIDEEKCTGCGLCAEACHEGAIMMFEGKAKLMRDDYCDGFGDCLPACPADAIHFVQREALEYDEKAVEAHKKLKEAVKAAGTPKFGGCPGSMAREIKREAVRPAVKEDGEIQSELMQWPVQIKLAPVRAPYFEGANLLIAADCSAYAYGDFHRRFIRNHVTVIGCPKLDDVDYTEKLTEIIRNNEIKSVTITRMEVPCCGGLEMAAKRALQNSGKFIPWQVVTISTDGQILDM